MVLFMHLLRFTKVRHVCKLMQKSNCVLCKFECVAFVVLRSTEESVMSCSYT